MLLYGEAPLCMPLELLPFPSYHRLSFGSVVGSLPVTREGIRKLPANTFPGTSHNCFAHLRVRRNVNERRCRAIGGLLHHSAFFNGQVLPHEKTLVARLKKQEDLVLPDRGALGKPILLTVPSLTEWWEQHDRRLATGDGFLCLNGEDNEYTLRDYAFKTPPPPQGAIAKGLPLGYLGPVVIADGHHRAETHARLGAQGVPGFEYVPVCLIGADELHIGVFARIITANCPGGDLMTELTKFFSITPLSDPVAPQHVGEWLMIHHGKHFRLVCKANPSDLTDVEWLNAIFLPQCFGISDVRTDDRITFEPVEDPIGGLIKADFPTASTTLVCYPLPKKRFFGQVNSGQVLPPKSTRFEPRIPSGLVVWIP